jgi:hypothetical protein
MGQVVANASMSLDGYIAQHDNTIGRLFDWLQNGEVEVRTVDDRITLHMSRPSAEYWHTWVDGLGALVCGRTLFDVTDGWGGMHTIGVPVVAVTAGTIARQCLERGLLDAVAVDLVPVVMGRGRPFFGELAIDDAPLGDPVRCVQGDRVTHLLFPVGRTSTPAAEGRHG